MPKSWTVGLRKLGTKLLPPEKLLPDGQPSYVSSWIYVFGVLTLGGLACAILSGLVLALEGPTWWHTSDVGHFVNSLHLWSVELFMAFLAIHLWGKFWMAAWRGRRWATWITGMLAFLAAIVEAFTGYLSQTNFDSQWIAFEAKDAFNAGGIGAYFNTMNFGQALMLHIVFIPLVLVLIVAVHITLVRVRGVVHPIEVAPEDVGAEEISVREAVGEMSDAPAAALKEAQS
jgi:quinol-cytochrome oxidoreductase complex cytochrome b subunit